MHTLHTTSAFVLTRYEHGESSYVYKLFTRELGLLYVHGQSVREIKNRNRYALSTHHRVEVTVVRGRGVWRLTGARMSGGVPDTASRKVLSLAGSLLAQEDPHPRLFDLLHEGCDVANVVEAGDSGAYEALFALKALHELGYVARPRSSVVDEFLMTDEHLPLLVVRARNRHADLVEAVNNALAHTGLPHR